MDSESILAFEPRRAQRRTYRIGRARTLVVTVTDKGARKKSLTANNTSRVEKIATTIEASADWTTGYGSR
jgi:galactose mutarotase-like enzyme